MKRTWEVKISAVIRIPAGADKAPNTEMIVSLTDMDSDPPKTTNRIIAAIPMQNIFSLCKSEENFQDSKAIRKKEKLRFEEYERSKRSSSQEKRDASPERAKPTDLELFLKQINQPTLLSTDFRIFQQGLQAIDLIKRHIKLLEGIMASIKNPSGHKALHSFFVFTLLESIGKREFSKAIIRTGITPQKTCDGCPPGSAKHMAETAYISPSNLPVSLGGICKTRFETMLDWMQRLDAMIAHVHRTTKDPKDFTVHYEILKALESNLQRM